MKSSIAQIKIENITPILNVKDMNVSRDFYLNKLGFTEATWGNDVFTSVAFEGASIYLCKESQGQPGTWIWIGFDGDIFSLFTELKARQVIIRQPPVNYSWALEMHVEDPDGHVLRFGTEPNPNEPFLDQ